MTYQKIPKFLEYVDQLKWEHARYFEFFIFFPAHSKERWRLYTRKKLVIDHDTAVV